MKERFQRFKFKMDADLSANPKMIIYYNNERHLACKMVDQDGHEIESELFEIEGFYIGDNKPNKVLYTQPVNENKAVTNVDAELAKYDVILVVDTSYDPISSPKIAFTSVMICRKVYTNDDEYEYQRNTQLLEWDASQMGEPENYMYAFAIEFLRDHYRELGENPRTAVIIDSGLENIPSYNDRTKAIFNNYFLPEGFFIFYASSDRGSEYFQNKLIKMCDKEAKEALKEYKKNSAPHVI